MKLVFPAAVLMLALASQCILPATAAADCVDNPNTYKPVEGLPTDGYPICYDKPDDAKYMQALADLQKTQILEKYAQFMSPLKLPHQLTLKSMQCGNNPSPFYSPIDRTLHFCYEWYQAVLDSAPTATTKQGVTREDVIVGMWAGTLMHETGHAMFDMLEVPVMGREEDAADEVAAFIPFQFNKDVQRTIIKGFAYFWDKMAQYGNDPNIKRMDPKDPNYPKTVEGRCGVDPFCAYSDVHGTASQRLYNTLCLGYGGDKDAFKDLVDMGWLPSTRAGGCADEFKQLQSAFVATILPFIDQDRLKKVTAISWLPTN